MADCGLSRYCKKKRRHHHGNCCRRGPRGHTGGTGQFDCGTGGEGNMVVCSLTGPAVTEKVMTTADSVVIESSLDSTSNSQAYPSHVDINVGSSGGDVNIGAYRCVELAAHLLRGIHRDCLRRLPRAQRA